MRTKTNYEWDYETTDEHGDIINHNHSDKLSNYYDCDITDQLVLVRDELDEGGSVVDRSWAYVKHGKLPEFFEDAYQRPTGNRVPYSYKKELTKYMEKKGIHFEPALLSDEYKKEFNEHSDDFIHLYKDGQKISDDLFRKGGLFREGSHKEPYFQLIHYTEAEYKDSITTDPARKKHLASRHVIVNDKGQITFKAKDRTTYPYLIKDSILVSADRGIHNIETGEFYCEAYNKMTTENYVFAFNEFDEDKSRRGMWQINKKTGEYKILK